MKNGDFTAHDLATAYLEVVKERNTSLNAYLEIFDDVTTQAEGADAMFKNGTATMLTGIPFSLKDNILIKDKRVSAGSKILEGYVAPYDSTIASILKKEGAVIIGRTNMDEFAMGSSTQTSAFGVTRNPLDESRVPGGSSGGAAASVAADMALAGLGSETCGSIRQPAAFCGLVGLKPTYGALSRSGVIAMGSSLDQIAPVTRTVRDAEIIFKSLSRHDALDSTSIPDDMRQKKNSLYGTRKKIGVPRSFLSQGGLDPRILDNFNLSLKKLEDSGYEIIDLDLPTFSVALAVYYIIMPAEVSTNLSRFDGVRYGLRVEGKDLLDTYMKSRGQGFGKEARRRIILGTYVLSHGYYDAYYNKAVKVRKLIEQEMMKAFEQVDFIATPTAPTLPFKIGEKLDDPVAMYLSDVFSAPANLAGCPSIALPSGMTEEGLPFSLQFTAPHFCEDSLFEVGKQFENVRE